MKKTQVIVRKPGLVEVIYHGDQNQETMEVIVNDIKSKITDFSGKVDYLIDMRDIGHTSLSARIAAVSNLNDLRIRRQALFGGSPFTRHMLNLMIHGIKKAGIIKHFESREEALVWLGIKL